MTNIAKPSWDDAPEWANYLARDKNGQWFWYENKPIALTGYWNNQTGKTMAINEVNDWKETLEKRPSPITSIWELLPQNVKYIAMDESGDWYGYEEKPCLDENDEDGMWSIDADEFYAEMLEDLISFDGSLIQRPD